MPPDPARVPADVLAVLRGLRAGGKQAWLAGGAVRDLVRGVPQTPQDFDVATDALPEEVRRLFPRTVPTGIQHGTITVLSGDHKVEVTTFRGEGPYLDGRRPSSVTFLGDIDGDLGRRDFTINAMAWDPIARVLRDPFGGERDLQRGRLRAVGDPLERFREDGLRALRAVRFACTLRLALEPATRRAIARAKSWSSCWCAASLPAAVCGSSSARGCWRASGPSSSKERASRRTATTPSTSGGTRSVRWTSRRRRKW